MEFLYGTAINYTYIAIGLGMVISLFLSETLGVMAGGVIVPGYFALYMHNPLMVVSTFLISIITYCIIIVLSKYMLIYGRRRLILSLLIGFFMGYLFRNLLLNTQFSDINYIGFIIPGLIASWMDRQGIIRTISVILIVASIVNLFMMCLYYLDNLKAIYV